MVNPNGGSEPWLLTSAGGLFFFTDRKQGDGTGVELWVSDGTPPGTYMVKDIFPGAGDSRIATMIEFDGKVYFGADDGVHGAELWISDGTSAGTTMVKDISPGTDSAIYLDNWELVRLGSTLYFRAANFSQGNGLWKSDGTESGTVLVREMPERS
jgi:ELWxxDGT repeat protein